VTRLARRRNALGAQSYYSGGYLYAGGAQNQVSRQGFFWRLDPDTGVPLWQADRHVSLSVLLSDVMGNVYSGGAAASGTNSSLEKWDNNANLIWGAACGGDSVLSIDLDGAGNVYALGSHTDNGGVNGSVRIFPKIYSFGPDGTPTASPDFPLDLNALLGISGGVGDSAQALALAVDKIDGRIAVALTPASSQLLEQLGGVPVLLLSADCSPISFAGVPFVQLPLNPPVEAFVGPVRNVAFDFWGRLIATGQSGGASTVQTGLCGFVADRQANVLYPIPAFQDVNTLAGAGTGILSVLIDSSLDGLGRIFLASTKTVAQQGQTRLVVQYTAQVASYSGSGLATLFFESYQFETLAIAAHPSGHFYLVATAYPFEQGALYALEAAGNLRWVNNSIWPVLGADPLICVS
jgi:hypothetical protein